MTITTLNKPSSLLDQPVRMALNWNWEKTLYTLLIIAALVTRFYDLGARVMSHDESLHTEYAWKLSQGQGYQHSPMMHGPLKFEVTAFLYWLLGDNDFTSRIPSALMGVATVGLMYFFRKWLGRAGALVAAFMALISPYLLYYARYIRDEPYVLVWGMLVALCVLHYMETRAAKYLYWLTAISALFYATMESSFIYIAITMLFLAFFIVADLLFVAKWPRREHFFPFVACLILTLVAVLVVGGLVLMKSKGIAVSGTETAVPINPAATATATPVAPQDPYTWPIMITGVVIAAGFLAGVFFAMLGFGNEFRRFPALDLLVIFGVFVLPQLTAFPVLALGRDPIDYLVPTTIPFIPPASGGGLPEMLGVFFQNVGIFFQHLPELAVSNMGATAVVLVLLVGVSVAIGWVWDRKKFIICAGIFYGIYLTLFTTFFTNGEGIATGLVGSLGYWVAQQGVQRGGQPWYYYPLINLPVYEFLPTLGALFAGGIALVRWLRAEEFEKASTSEIETEMTVDGGAEIGGKGKPKSKVTVRTLRFPALGYLAFWAVMALIAFSVAGEKMPWLTTHIALPLILMSGWGIGQVIDRTDWRIFREARSWLLLAVLLVWVAALASVLGFGPGGLLGAQPPFQGRNTEQIRASMAFLTALLIILAGGVGLYLLSEKAGRGNVARLAVLAVFSLLSIFTARAALVAAYINYDDANEFLVYAHGARGNKTVLQQLDDITARTKDGMGLKVAYDSAVSWPLSWYLRYYDKNNSGFFGDTPTRDNLNTEVIVVGSGNWDKVERLIGDRYYKFEYIRMVWPMQDYFNLTTPAQGFVLAPGNCIMKGHYDTDEARIQDETRIKTDCASIWGGIWSNASYRQALWNIWLNRDYTLYGQLTNQNFALSQWPVVDRMRFYVRKDIAVSIWSYGVGPTALANPAAEDPYVKSRQTLTAEKVWGVLGETPGSFNAPRAIAVAPDGSLYVADSFNNRIQQFDPAGNPLLNWGGLGPVMTGGNKSDSPWGVAVGPDGSVYVADTWAHRVMKYDARGQFVRTWGREGQDNSLETFWGPRAVAVDATGRVYVADTGNKRIVVFDQDGNGLTSFGGKGSDAGLLDEPVGVAIGPDGAVYVADTWNMRIQVFTRNEAGQYSYLREWPVMAWDVDSPQIKPYLALDPQERVYVTDPGKCRVLVFDKSGQFLTTWGDCGTDDTTFGVPSGIAVDQAGYIYVTDAGNHRVMKFAPLK